MLSYMAFIYAVFQPMPLVLRMLYHIVEWLVAQYHSVVWVLS